MTATLLPPSAPTRNLAVFWPATSHCDFVSAINELAPKVRHGNLLKSHLNTPMYIYT